MRRFVAIIGLLVCACGARKQAPVERVVPVAAPAAAPAPPTCTMPAQMAVSQVADEDAGRLLVVETRTGDVVWQGPPGSGESPARWSRDGRLLAYVVGEDIVVHADRGPDELAYRGLDDGGPFALSARGRWLAATGDSAVFVVDLSADPRTRKPVDLGVATCTPGFLGWAPASDQLVIWCEDDGRVRVWDPRTRELVVHDFDAIEGVLGWWAGGAAALVEHEDGGLWTVALDGEAGELFEDRSSESGRVAEAAVAAASIATFSDYDADEGYPRTVWLARHRAPALAWLDGFVADLSFTPDGAWAAFTTAIDSVDEAGDIYVARVGEPRVTQVLSAPRDDPGLDDDGGDAEVDEDQEEKEGDDEVLYIGFAEPVFRPEPGSVCEPALAAGRHRLEAVGTVGGEDAALEPGGVLLDDSGDQPQLIVGGDRSIVLDDTVTWSSARRLANGILLVRDDTGHTRWLNADGTQVTSLKIRDDDVVGVGAVAAAWRTARDTIEVRDGAGAVMGRFTHGDGIEAFTPRGDGLLVESGADDLVSLDGRGAEIARFDAPDAVLATGLAGGGVAAVESGFDHAEDHDDQWLRVYSYRPNGTRIGRHRVPSEGGEAAHLLALPDGGFVVTAGEERSKAFFFDSQARLRGTFKLGLLSERPPAVMGDGTVVMVAAGERELLLVDGRGRYLGGAVVDDVVVEGPFVVAGDRIMVATDAEVIAFERR